MSAVRHSNPGRTGSAGPGPILARVGLMLFIAAFAASCARSPAPPAAPEPPVSAADDTAAEHASKHADALYRCPMHPEIVRNEPGVCPICGMTLVKVEPPSTGMTATSGSATGAAGPEVRISPAVINNLGVRTAVAVRSALPRRADTVGYVGFDERRVQQVRPRAEGWVEGLAVRAMGETVRTGQVLFTLYSPMLESAQQEYLDALEIGNQDLIAASRERLRALGLEPDTAARTARSGRASGRVAYTAPISGVVTELELKEGAMVTPEMVALTITELGSLWVIAEVPEGQSGWVTPGTVAEIHLPSLPGQPVGGKVEYVYPELDMESRTLRARITLDDPPAAVRPNMLATVSLVGAGGEEAVNIPRSALIRSGTEDRVVLSLGEGRFAPRRVVAGVESGERVAIVSGLEVGESVVVAGQFLLDSEANLRSGLGRLGDESTDGAAPAADHSGH
jgi:Cu(I)/Ag(I) efflux system membrane fusion protein